jgi:hypothetical protein
MKWPLPDAEFVVEPMREHGTLPTEEAAPPTYGQRYIAKLFAVRGEAKRLMWDIEVDDSPTAWKAMRADMHRQARDQHVDFDGLVDALRRELLLPERSTVLLALELTFPLTLASTQLRIQSSRTGKRGHPAAVDAQTFLVARLGAAWLRATGRHPSLAERGVFLRTMAAAQPFLPIRARRTRKEIRNMRTALKAEVKKLKSGRVWFIKRASGI